MRSYAEHENEWVCHPNLIFSPLLIFLAGDFEEAAFLLGEAAFAVLVDLIEGATSLPDYVHPERAFYIFGPEDGTLDPARFAAVKEVIYVPTQGCMNLAASVNVILYDRLAKRLRAKG